MIILLLICTSAIDFVNKVAQTSSNCSLAPFIHTVCFEAVFGAEAVFRFAMLAVILACIFS